MLYEDYLVETIFTSPEIGRLRSAYNKGQSEYVSDVIKDIFKGRGVDIQEQDVTYLTNTIKYYML